MSVNNPTYQELANRLAAAEPIVEALRRHEVDAVVGHEKIAFLLLRGVEEALLTSEAAFRVMFDLPAVGMFLAVPPDLRFTRVNQKFCEITGYPAEELLTKTILSLTHPSERGRDMKGLARVLRGETDSWTIEKPYLRKDGGIVRVAVNGAALRDASGIIVRVVAMVREITTDKQDERALRKESAPKAGKPKRTKKAAAKKVPAAARAKPPAKPRAKKR